MPNVSFLLSKQFATCIGEPVDKSMKKILAVFIAAIHLFSIAAKAPQKKGTAFIV